MSQCQLWYVRASLASLVFEDWQVYLHVAPSFPMQGNLPWHECLEPPDLSDTDATDEDMDNAELISLSNPWSDENEGDWGGATHSSQGSAVSISALTPDEPDED